MVELRHLRYFLAVAEELHFGRAAKRVHISQPPLSQQIRQLEEDLGIQLFYRTRRRVELTDAGRVFAGEVRLILEQVERATGMAQEATRGKLDRLVVACSPANSYFVVKILTAFAARHPDARLVVKSLVSSEQVEALRNNRIDVGFVSSPVEDESLAVETILSEPLVVALPTRHPLSHRRRITLRALSGDTMIVFPLHMSPGRYQLITGMCRRSGISLSILHEVDNLYTMLDLVAAGFGVCLMRASVQGMAHKGVVFRELLHSPFVETGIAFRRENTSPVVPQLIETSKAVAALGSIPKPR